MVKDFIDSVIKRGKVQDSSSNVPKVDKTVKDRFISPSAKRSFADLVKQKPTTKIDKVDATKNHKTTTFWVRKEEVVVDLNLNSLFVVSKVMAHYSCEKIKLVLEDYCQA